MKKSLLPLLVLGVFLFSFLIIAQSEEDVEISEDVLEEIEEEGEVDVIIVMKEGEVTNKVARALGILEEQGEDTEERKELVVEKLEEEDDFEVETDLDMAIAGTITEDQLEILEDDPNIEEIYINEPVKAFLDDSRSQIKADIIQSLIHNGTNVTGSGETVCVIDTGILYTHTALGGCIGQGCKVIDGYDFVNDDDDPTDDNGHGTHVSGIIASSDSTYRGVAPDVNLIGIKVLAASGLGSSSDVIAGINWCVDNSSLYNITVISMSLGTLSTFSGICDNSDSQMTQAIANASRLNISVIASTGNAGSTTGIGRPACISNATSVSSVTSTNSISSFSNRNNVTDLFAPGSSIKSTSNDGDFETQSGTSQAAPHVSGAFALVRQFLRLLNNTNQTPQSIATSLNRTGDVIDDSSGSGFEFKTINLENLFDSMDNESPKISFVSPTVNDTTTTNYHFFINISANETISSAVLQFDGVNESLVSGSNIFSVNKTFSANGQHSIRVFGNDTFNNSASTLLFNFTINNTRPVIQEVVINTTNINQSNYTTEDITLWVNATDVDGETIYAYVRWFNDSNELGGLADTITLVDNGLDLVATVLSGNTTKSQNWTAMVIVGDGGLNTTPENYSLLINDTPQSTSQIANQSWYIDTNISINISDFFSDNDGDILSYTASSTSSITVSIVSDNVTFIPDLGFGGNETVTITSSNDSNVESNQVTLFVGYDRDLDGFNSSAFNGTDCNDNNANINTGKSEVCDDSTDNDCDGSIDEGCSSSPSASSGGGGGGGGSGGSGGSNRGASAIKSYGRVSVGETLSVEVTAKEIPVNSISFETKNLLIKPQLKVFELTSEPNTLTKPESEVYEYFEVDLVKIKDSDIVNAEILFEVDFDWLEQNSFATDDVLLQRYVESVWNDLDTEYLRRQGDEVYYRSESPGFSYFAITGGKGSSAKTQEEIKGEQGGLEEQFIEDIAQDPEIVAQDKVASNQFKLVHLLTVLLGAIVVIILVKKFPSRLKNKFRRKSKREHSFHSDDELADIEKGIVKKK
jgi:PGF-pre-PGF domain-containing protein